VTPRLPENGKRDRARKMQTAGTVSGHSNSRLASGFSAPELFPGPVFFCDLRTHFAFLMEGESRLVELQLAANGLFTVVGLAGASPAYPEFFAARQNGECSFLKCTVISRRRPARFAS